MLRRATVAAPTSPLVGFHLRSFERFLQAGVAPDERRDEGLQHALRAAFPVCSGDGLAELELVDYALEAPRYDEGECLRRGFTLAAPLKVTVRLVIWDPPDEMGRRLIRDIKEQECYFGELPLMTARGTFVVDGAERVLTPSLVPRPGVRRLRAAQGATVTFRDTLGDALELERPAGSELVSLRFAPGPFTPPGTLLIAPPAERTLHVTPDGAFAPFDKGPCAARAAPRDVLAPDGTVLVAKGQKLTARRVKALRDAGAPGVPLSPRELARHRTRLDVHAPDGSLVLEAHRPLRAAAVQRLVAAGVTEVITYVPDEAPSAPEPPRVRDASAASLWMYEHLPSFDLGESGRAAVERALGPSRYPDATELTQADLEAAFAWLWSSSDGDDEPGYAVVAAGEMLTVHALRGLRALARDARERIDPGDVETYMPHDLLNAKPLARALRTLLESPALGAPLAQRNPLASLRHLRRVAMGAGVSWPGAIDGFATLPPDVVVGPSGEVSHPSGAAPWPETMCRAEPLARPEAPPSPTRFEREVVRATGAVTLAERDGRALVIDGRVVLVVPDDPEADVQVHELAPFRATNDATSRAERAAVADGARVRAGDVIAEGEAVVAGSLALGRAVRVALSDAVPAGEARVSERALREGWFTSRWAPTRARALRDTAHGCEELTATPPDAEGDVARHLDASGIVTVGAAVRPGDVLVGVRRPGPAGAWEGASLRAPEAAPAVVRHVEVFERRGRERCPRSESLRESERALWEKVEARAREAMSPDAAGAFEALADLCRTRVERTHRGDDLAPGVIAVVRVTLEIARALSPGDTLADRHGFAAAAREAAPDDATTADVLLSAAEALPEATRAEIERGALYLMKIER